MVQWDYFGGNNQKFWLLDTGEGYYMLQALHSSLCLDVYQADPEDGGTVVQWSCFKTPNQRFRFLPY